MIEKYPDWRSPKEYPTDDTTDYQIAWEFLRRSHAYREFYKNNGKDWPPGKNLSKDIQDRFGLDPTSALVDPSSAEPYTTAYFGGTRNNPDLKIDFYIMFKGEDPSIYHGPGYLTTDTQVLVRFDLSAPLDPQLAKAKQRLASSVDKSASKFRKRRNLYARYLRVFDAMEQNVDKSTIGKILFPEKINIEDTRKAIENAYDAAKNMTIDGYRYLGVGAFQGRTVPQRTIMVLPKEK